MRSRRRCPSYSPILVALLLTTGAAGAAMAGELGFNPMGDGSASSNGDFQHDLSTGCASCSAPPREWGAPPADLDWSLSLRGAITNDDGGTRYELIAVPEARLVHQTLRGGYELGVSAELGYAPETGSARIGGLTLDARAEHRFDAVTSSEVTARLSLSQDDPGSGDFADSVEAAPLVIEGVVEGAVRRDFGPFDAEGRWNLGRKLNGDTLYEDGSSIDNTHDDVSVGGLGGRVGVRLGPMVRAFVDGNVERELYDAASPNVGARLDNYTYALRGGFEARLGPLVEAEASIGYGYRDFEVAGLGDFGQMLFDGRITVRPAETLALGAELTTSFDGPGSMAGARARVTHRLAGTAAYEVNPWLTLRGSAGWSEALSVGTDTAEVEWTVGAGADYQLNQNMQASADYQFSRTQTMPAPQEDAHRLTLGLTLDR